MEHVNPTFCVNIINPSFAFGSKGFGEDAAGDFNASITLFVSVFTLKPEESVIGYGKSFIDVRDLAKAHVYAFENDDINRQRLLMHEEDWSCQKILDILHENFPQVSGKLSKGESGKYESNFYIENSKTRNTMSFNFNGLKTSVVDLYNQYLKVNPQ